jgi:hypothetical protein
MRLKVFLPGRQDVIRVPGIAVLLRVQGDGEAASRDRLTSLVYGELHLLARREGAGSGVRTSKSGSSSLPQASARSALRVPAARQHRVVQILDLLPTLGAHDKRSRKSE